ncbi:hypothetical protein SADUNF_Sadunf01G0055900 [Salix dunnii]|uniref:Uncharacterized protein n=1 Tax=Salix dunnii TaxID=1413687 RepID=A0A835NA33_9ROSI|nr:hypothetical protein SADUNF_Sadunf01G0055900 [Salix dunnii]
MVLSATVVGALLGLGTQMYSNALRKLPYMRHPWEHVVGMGLGVVFVNQLVKWDAKLEQDLDKMLQKAKEANERRYFVSLVHDHGEGAPLPGLTPHQSLISPPSPGYASSCRSLVADAANPTNSHSFSTLKFSSVYCSRSTRANDELITKIVCRFHKVIQSIVSPGSTLQKECFALNLGRTGRVNALPFTHPFEGFSVFEVGSKSKCEQS